VPIEAPRPAHAPVVTVEPTDPSHVGPAVPSASASAVPPTPQAVRSSGRPGTAPSGSARRSKDHGLVETNPFQ
jgi:hypothetical protein